MKKITWKAFVVGIIAGLLVICDSIISRILHQTASFTWIAFVSWTVFFGATTKERLKAIVGYIIGFISAFVIIKLGNLYNLNFFSINIFAVLATVLVNFICIELENFDKHFPISVSGIFVGIAMVFSGLGINLGVDTFQNSILMLAIILIYGILGLLSGWATLQLNKSKD